jgi:UDP-N-acetylglucosamine 2-epimerase (non-hydrolysing)
MAAHLRAEIVNALECERPEIVLAQGDTTSVVTAALAAFQCGVPFGHVEAGLRTGRLFAPFPEEANRVVTTHLTTLHFAPTESARENLEREGINRGRIFVTGNTVIDSLLATASRPVPIGFELPSSQRLILVTAHRRESFGAPLRAICEAVAEIHDRFTDVAFLWPIHPNPSVRPIVENLLSGRARVQLTEPLGYGRFVSALERSSLVLTDSGGIQEEAPALGKPVLVMRAESERPEAIEAGVARLVGTDRQTIVAETSRLLADIVAYRSMARGASPYGDGQASRRIAGIVFQYLRNGSERRGGRLVASINRRNSMSLIGR